MSSSFIPDYLTWASDNEAPEMFHVWGGFMAISTVICRRVWIPWGRKALYPNLYILLVGDAGNGKSIAMDYYRMLMQEPTGKFFGERDAPLSNNVETPQGLLRFMGGNPKAKPPIESPVSFPTKMPNGELLDCHPMTILANEFTNFINMDQEGWMGMLNDISDRDRNYTYRTKGQGSDIIWCPYICLFGGMPTEASHDLQRAKVIASGFARRTIFQFGVRDWGNPRPFITEKPEQLSAFTRLVAHLNRLPALYGGITWDNSATKFWDEWYRAHNVMVPKRAPQVRSWFGTKPDHVLRLALNVILSEYDLDPNKLILHKRHIEVAITFLERMEGDLYRVFGGTGRNDLMPVVAAIHAYVCGLTEPIGKKQILIHFIKDLPRRQDMHKELDQCLEILSNDGKIATCQVGLTSPTKPDQIAAYETFIGIPEVITSFVAKHGGKPPTQQT